MPPAKCRILAAACLLTTVTAYKCPPSRGEARSPEREVPLSIGVLLPSPYRSRIEPSVELALTHVHEEQDLLPGYCLHLIYKDTQCRTSLGMKSLFDLMNTRYNHSVPRPDEEGGSEEEGESGEQAERMVHRPLALFGDICTDVNEPVAMASKYWNILHLSFAETHAKFATAESNEVRGRRGF